LKKIILIFFIIPLTIFGQKYQEPDFINLLDDENWRLHFFGCSLDPSTF
tara:strand:- start:8660 stop:8806 length:147 start_codon:yes stop_codon:yes gene_type:complete